MIYLKHSQTNTGTDRIFYKQKQVTVLLEYNMYKSHFFVPENQSKNGGATYTLGYVRVLLESPLILMYLYYVLCIMYLFASTPICTYLINVIESQ